MLINEFIGELLTWVAENGLNINDVHVSHGGTCMLLGLKESTDDIDLTVSAEIFEAYKAKGFKETQLKDNRSLIAVTDHIDIHVIEPWVNEDCLRLHASGIWYRDAVQTIRDYEYLNREKDQIVIQKLTALLQRSSTSLLVK